MAATSLGRGATDAIPFNELRCLLFRIRKWQRNQNVIKMYAE
jgi:hypothetical protein